MKISINISLIYTEHFVIQMKLFKISKTNAFPAEVCQQITDRFRKLFKGSKTKKMTSYFREMKTLLAFCTNVVLSLFHLGFSSCEVTHVGHFISSVTTTSFAKCMPAFYFLIHGNKDQNWLDFA